MNHISYPNESVEYRAARNELLKAEMELRAQIERVAEQRRELPPGGLLKEDYVFQEMVDGQVVEVKFSELFGDKQTLFLYSFMYGPDMKQACSSCTSLGDGFAGQAIHFTQRISFAMIAKHPIEIFHEHAATRGWRNVRLLSSANTTYNVDYHGEVNGRQMTNANVFTKDGDEIRHFWGSEMVFAPRIEGGESRHVDLLWPLWNVLDMTPGGRGDLQLKLAY